MKIEERKLGDLKPYENNPRKNDEAVNAVVKSIEEFGFKNPIIIDKDDVIIAGHTRYKAAKKLGLEKVPTIKAEDLTPEQVKAFRLADNKVSEIAAWDMTALGEELKDISEIDMSDFGFDLSLFEDDEELDEDVDEFEEEVESRCKPGDLWQLGNHKLICGDSTSFETLERLMGGQQADLLITDPPYNVNYGAVRDVSEAIKRKKRRDGLIIQNDNMDDESFRQFLRDAFSTADSVMRPGAVFYIWHADNESYNFRGACRDNEWQIRECLIWNKSSLVLGRQDYQWKHEPCLYGWKEGASHYWGGDRSQTTVLEFDKPNRSELHPTMKPVALFAYQIKNSSKKGDNVLDMFGGSGTTLIACQELDRKAYICELDPHYCDVIIARWEELTKKQAVLL